MLEKLLRKAGMSLGPRLLVIAIRGVAEGKYGPALKAVYWWLAGRKRLAAMTLGAGSAVLFTLGYIQEAAYVATGGGILLAVGLLDAGWRDVKPSNELTDNRLYRFLANNAATITSGLATAYAFVEAGQCGSYDCATLQRGILVLGAVAAYFGVADAAWRAAPPFVLPGRKR